MKRLQLRHHDELFSSRELALNFFSDILNPNHVNSDKFGTSLYAEPMVAKYIDNDGKVQILFAIGTDTPDAPYHIIDSAELSERIDTEIARTIAAEAVLEKKIDNEIERATAEEIKIQNTINGEIVRATETEAVLDKKIEDNLTSIVSVEPSGANILEEYALKNAKNELLGEHIRIYKDSSLVGAVTGFKGAKSVEKVNNTFVLTYDEATRDENVEYLYLIYRNEEGLLKLVGIDFENFLMEAEFGDGMKVVDHVASIKIKEGEKYLIADKDGLYSVNIDETISTFVNEEKARAEAVEVKLQNIIDKEVVRATETEAALDIKLTAEVDRAITKDDELQKSINEINAEVKANKVESKDVVLNVSENGTNLTIQTDEVTITKMADAGTIYDTNIAVFGSLLKVKKVTPTNTSIKSRYELQGADGKLIGDAIELPVESALVDVRQGKLGASIDVATGIYTEGTGDITMDFIYRLEDGNYKLVQIVVSEYFTDSHFGRGLNNQDGIVSLLEGDGNEYLVIGEDTLAVVGVDAAINKAKQEAISEANIYSDTKVSDLSLYVDTFVSTSVNNAVESLNQTIKSNVETLNNTINTAVETLNNTIDSNVSTLNNTINVESERAVAAENALSERIYNEESLRVNADKDINARIDKEIADRTAADESLREAITSSAEGTIEEAKVIVAEEIAKVVAGAPEDLDTLKEIATWIQNDTTGSAQMANDVNILKNKVTELETKIAVLETRLEYLEKYGGGSSNGDGTVSILPEDIKEIIKDYLAGSENEIKVEANADNTKLTIGFADDAIFG